MFITLVVVLIYIEYNLYLEKDAFILPTRKNFVGMKQFLKDIIPTMLLVGLGMWALNVVGVFSGYIEKIHFNA